ncbi:MAG: hypothetical protein GX761_08230 [Gammaproteobacteria bacterium]|nr:hypothetical protein [Gammaproteobacteria bacterium]
MEFHIGRDARMPDISVLEDALLGHDPAALIDLDPAAGLVRISTWLAAGQLAEVLGAAGWVIQPDRIEQQPSVCCGGCGG